MANDTMKTRMALVILRGALALIFIWHGLDKLTGPLNGGGGNWARRLWQEQTEPPPSLMAKLKELPTDAWLNDSEKQLADDKQQELAGVRLRETEQRVQQAYAAGAAPLPGVLSPTVQYLIAWGELVGGLALLVGFLTRVAAAGLLVIQLGAIYFLTGIQGLSSEGNVGYEYNLVLAAMCLTVLVLGGEGWAVDRYLPWGRKRVEPKPAEAPERQPVGSAR